MEDFMETFILVSSWSFLYVRFRLHEIFLNVTLSVTNYAQKISYISTNIRFHAKTASVSTTMVASNFLKTWYHCNYQVPPSYCEKAGWVAYWERFYIRLRPMAKTFSRESSEAVPRTIKSWWPDSQTHEWKVVKWFEIKLKMVVERWNIGNFRCFVRGLYLWKTIFVWKRNCG